MIYRHDCDIFMLRFIEYLLVDHLFDFGYDDMPYIRQKYAFDLLYRSFWL